MKLRNKAFAALLTTIVVSFMLFGTLSMAFAAAVPTADTGGDIADQFTGGSALPQVPAAPTTSVPSTSALPIPGLDSLSGGLGGLLDPVLDAVGSTPLAPVVDTLTGVLEDSPLAPVLGVLNGGALPMADGANPLQPLLDILDPSMLPIPGLGGGGDGPMFDSALAPLFGPLNGGLETLRGPLTDGLAPLKDALAPIEDPLREGLAPVKDIVEELLLTLDPVLFPILDALSPVLCPVLEVLAPVIAYLASICPGILPPCPEPEPAPEPPIEDEGDPIPVIPVEPTVNPVTGGGGGVLPFTGANLTAMIVLLMALAGTVVALRRAHLVLKAREQ